MTITDKLIDQVATNAAQARLVDVCIGAFWTAVTVELAGQTRTGISSTLHGGDDDHHHGGGPPVRAAGALHERSVMALAAMARAPSVLEVSVGIATINALLEVDIEDCVNVNAAGLIVERGAGKKVAIVGHFPFISRIRETAEETWVLEMDPRKGDIPAAQAPDLIPQANVVALTGTSLLNHTFDDLIVFCRPEAYVVVLGGTTPLSRVFFDYSVDAVAGTRIVDSTAALATVSQGATFRQIRGKQLLTLFKNKA